MVCVCVWGGMLPELYMYLVLVFQALQSSEEARIAFRFSAHLEKMHTQLLNPDTVTPFRSHHDILARLLPYHVYAEPEPPPAAVEKGMCTSHVIQFDVNIQ